MEDKYKVGQVLTNEDGDEKTVLAVCGNVVGLSLTYNQDIFSDWFTQKELDNNGFTLKSESQDVIKTAWEEEVDKLIDQLKKIKKGFKVK